MSQAAADIHALYDYTIRDFGLEQARAYVHGLTARLDQLAHNPNIGRRVTELSAELRRVDYRAHMIFYTAGSAGPLIVRVLHQSMDAKRHS